MAELGHEVAVLGRRVEGRAEEAHDVWVVQRAHHLRLGAEELIELRAGEAVRSVHAHNEQHRERGMGVERAGSAT